MVEARKPGSELGVTATGPVEILSGEESHECNLRIHRRYLSPETWTWWDMPELDVMYFGGRFGSTPGYLLPQEL
jgi:hypothetical protein